MHPLTPIYTPINSDRLLGRTLCLGRADPELLEGFEVCREAQAQTARRCRPGTLAADIGRSHDAFMLEHGGVRELRLYAHGMGYDMVERPLIREDETMVLEAGCSLAIHPTHPTRSMHAHICDNLLIGLDGQASFIHETPKQVFEALGGGGMDVQADVGETVAADTNYALQVRYTLRAFTRALSVVAGSVGLTAAEFRLLRTLGDGEATTQTELAALAAMDRPYVSTLVRRMTAKGMFRPVQNALDRRRTDIVLTAEGKRVLDMLSLRLAAVTREAVVDIGLPDLAVFMSVAARMQANLGHYF